MSDDRDQIRAALAAFKEEQGLWRFTGREWGDGHLEKAGWAIRVPHAEAPTLENASERCDAAMRREHVVDKAAFERLRDFHAMEAALIAAEKEAN